MAGIMMVFMLKYVFIYACADQSTYTPGQQYLNLFWIYIFLTYIDLSYMSIMFSIVAYFSF